MNKKASLKGAGISLVQTGRVVLPFWSKIHVLLKKAPEEKRPALLELAFLDYELTKSRHLPSASNINLPSKSYFSKAQLHLCKEGSYWKGS